MTIWGPFSSRPQSFPVHQLLSSSHHALCNQLMEIVASIVSSYLVGNVLLLSNVLPNTGTSWGFVLLSSVAQMGNCNTLPHQSSLLARFLIPVTVITPTVPLCPSCLIFRILEIIFPDTSLSFSDFNVPLLQIALYSMTLESVSVTHIFRWRVNLFYPCPRTTQSIMSFSKLALCHSLHFYVLVWVTL